jgi:sugar phosphate isomerase/epimerase
VETGRHLGKKVKVVRKYAVILGNLRNTKDRFCDGYKNNPATPEMLRQASRIPHVRGIELVGTWDIRPENVSEMRQALGDLGLQCVSIIPDLFGQQLYGKGSYSSADPKVRRHAIDYTRQMCDIAGELSCQILNLWPGQDGYDYLLAADYEWERQWMCEAVSELAGAYPELKFALEYKPKEPRTHCYLARMADTLLFVYEVGYPNVGVTIDTGHAFVAGEVVGEAIVLAKRAGNRLFHMHFNDNHMTTDDDMIVGTVHSVCYLEMLYWLDRCGYDGWLSMDQYPYREDAAGAIGESILWLRQFSEIVEANRTTIDALVAAQDPIATSRFLRGALSGRTDIEQALETASRQVPVPD